MSRPIEVDVPHQLPIATAKARMDKGIGRIAEFVPGGNVTEKRWDGDTMILGVSAFGQRAGARLTVLENRVHAVFDLPAMLLPFAEALRGQLEQEAAGLLK